MNPSRLFRALHLVFLLPVMTMAAETPVVTKLQLTLAGSAVFGSGVNVPFKDAALFLDSTNFDGKSGFVRLQKGMTAAYLALSTREISGETTGDFEKKSFLQRNVTPLPKLPELEAAEDCTVLIGVLDIYDPRRQETSTLQQAMAGQPITQLTTMAPWVSAVKIPSIVVDTIQFHIVDAVASTPSAPGKEYSNHAPAFRNGGTVIVYGPDQRTLHLQCKQEKPPFDSAPVILRRDGDRWTAIVALESKEITILGSVPVRLMPPVTRTINEYAGKN